MNLTEFIQTNHKTIIEEWVKFAKTISPWADDMSDRGLQDHAAELLTAIVKDMKSPQSRTQKSEKSKGNALDGQLARVGEKHASDRLETGMNLNQLVSEYRALRASVMCLWEEAQGDEQGEVTRFNESIDETLAISAERYSETVENTREQFLGILSHDLQNPIGAVTMGATLLTKSRDPNTVDIATLILKSGERMSRLVNDLLDFTRTRLGSGIPLNREAMELTSVCRHAVSELKTMHPNRLIQFESSGDLHGDWDGDRLAQVVSNLVANSLQYGDSNCPVKVVVKEHNKEVVLQVHNEGPPIPTNAIKTIFSPMTRYRIDGQNSDKNKKGLGLGLFIASEIVTAHSGAISVTSSIENGTTFTVKLPR